MIMKNILILLFCLMVAGSVSAQVENAGDAAKNGATDHANNDINSSVDNGLNKTENSIKGLFKKKKKNNNQQSNDNQQNNSQQGNSQALSGGGSGGTGTMRDYKNYDFVPGTKIIFESQLADERTGEIPSQFVLDHGQMDIQQEDGENVIHVPKGPGATMMPRMKNTTGYMPDQFTIEFDFKNERFGIEHLMIDFGSRVYYADKEGVMHGMTFSNGSLGWTLGDSDYPDALNEALKNPMTWHHVAIAINKTAGKVYIDQYRVANVNNLTGKPKEVTIDVNGYENSWIKNIRIAAGGIDIYKQVTTDNKIITHGILFDVDKSTIKPESMGTINTIYDILKKDPNLKFEIDGHTDNSGNSPHNLTLSQQRADAVKAQLVSMGIDASRLSTKGFGDTKPISDNNSPEGKANNRRVEFVKTT